MGIERKPQIDRASAEQLLAGDTTTIGVLGEVLAAAWAPASPAELRGEDDAVARFRAVRTHLSPRSPGRQRPARAVTRLLTANFAVMLMLVGVGIGGVAVAASTGFLPALPHHHGTSDGPASRRPSRDPSGSTSAQTATDLSSPSSSPAGSQSTSLRGLCHAYTATVERGNANAVNDPAFARLFAAAGGAMNVASYCRSLIASAPGGASSGVTVAPHPIGKPTAHSTGKASAASGGPL
jgi:hypothetical protein